MEDEVFIRDIIDTPADDGVRLIFADWLDDQGQTERAEFIRVQCEAERWRTIDSRAGTSWKRGRGKLIGQERRPWLGRLNGSLRHRVFRRGFLVEARINAKTLLANVEPFFPPGADQRTLELEGAANYLAEIAALPQARKGPDAQLAEEPPRGGTSGRWSNLPTSGAWNGSVSIATTSGTRVLRRLPVRRT